MGGMASWWCFTGILFFAVPSGVVEAKFRRSDIESESWSEFPVHFSPLKDQSVLLSKLSWNSSSVFPPRAKLGQGGLYADQMVGILGSHSGAVRATFGPFSVEDSLERERNNSNLLDFDVKAEVATRFVSPHNSRIQILFLLRAKHSGIKTMPCLRARAHFSGAEVVAACTPSSTSSSCLAQITIPPDWWQARESTSIQTLQVSYSVHMPPNSDCLMGTSDLLVPERSLGDVQFQQRQEALKTIKEDEFIWLHIPKMDVAVQERFQIAVSIHQNFTAAGCLIRAKARRGLRVVDVHPANQNVWNVLYKVKQGGASAMVTIERSTTTATPPTEHGLSVDMTAFTVEFEVENTTSSTRLVNWRIDSTNVVTTIPVASQSSQALIPITWADDIVNTAVLNGQRVSVPISVITVTRSGQVHNITASAQCTSLDPEILKVKQDCSAVYVDGSETSGALGKKILVSFAGREVYREFNVWYPELPLEVVLSDPKLSQIRGWKIPVPKERSRRDSQQALSLGAETLGLLGRGDLEIDNGRDHMTKGKCQLRHQQSKVNIYTRFYAPQANTVPRVTGRRQYLYGDDIRHHVTHHTKSQLRALDPSVVLVEGTRVTGLTTGDTLIQVVSPDGQKILGESNITVSANKAEVIELHVSLVSGLTLEAVPLGPEDGGRDRSLTRVTSRRVLFAQFQEAIMDARLEFDDGTEVALQDINPKDFEAVITTLNPEIVAESPGSTPHHPAVIAVKEGSTTLMLEVALPLECQRRKRNSAISFDVIPVNVSFAEKPEPWWPNGMDEVGMDDSRDGLIGRIGLTPEVGAVDYGVVRGDYDPERKKPHHRGGGNNKPEGGIISIPIDIPIGDMFPKNPAVDYGAYDEDLDNDANNHLTYSQESLSPLEIGMYIVLGIFCIAILAFMVNCVLFMARYRNSKKVPAPMGNTYPQNWVLFGTEFDGRTLPHPHFTEERIPMRDFRDESNHDDCCSRGEHTCTESEVSIERHSIEDEQDGGCQEDAGRSVAMVRSDNNEEGPHCHHACSGESEESVSCVIAEGHETSEFLPCQCECHFDENVQNSSSEIDIELVEESECTERTPLKHQSEPSNIPTAGACCDITGDTHSDTHPDTPSDTHSNSELRVTITTGELESPTGSTKSQDDVDLEIVLDQADEEQISC
ncbi:transmembrane protein 132E-like [Asterias rubens]|uniref:transmembrane protein 132E-like n=1 Tax=Asterias rubens TaxID=7604 RepID=UPI001455055C|nr:transmembrane protein 132E-like [Asterias rubens]